MTYKCINVENHSSNSHSTLGNFSDFAYDQSDYHAFMKQSTWVTMTDRQIELDLVVLRAVTRLNLTEKSQRCLKLRSTASLVLWPHPPNQLKLTSGSHSGALWCLQTALVYECCWSTRRQSEAILSPFYYFVWAWWHWTTSKLQVNTKIKIGGSKHSD